MRLAGGQFLIDDEALPRYTRALLEKQFAYRGELFGRRIPAEPDVSLATPCS
jgi:hypothetical protein